MNQQTQNKIVAQKLEEINKYLGLSLAQDDYFKKLRRYGDGSYSFNVSLNERVSESRAYSRLLSLVKTGIVSRVEGAGLERVVIFFK